MLIWGCRRHLLRGVEILPSQGKHTKLGKTLAADVRYGADAELGKVAGCKSELGECSGCNVANA